MLPLEPSSPTLEQIELGKKYLNPNLSEFTSLMQYLRILADNELSKKIPTIDNKPYPYGQCYFITVKVMEILKELIAKKNSFNNNSTRVGFLALIDFLKSGGKIDRVWGDLRGEYFQNAFRIGEYYVDVSNDTVELTKPPLEILPYQQAQIVAIRDFHHFAELGAKYWKRTFYVNTLFPELAPFCPLLSIDRYGTLRVEGNDYTIALASINGFALAQKTFLEFPSLPHKFALDDASSVTKVIQQINKLIGVSPFMLEEKKQEAIKKVKHINNEFNFKSEEEK